MLARDRGKAARDWRIHRRDLLCGLYGVGLVNAVVAEIQTSTTGAGDLFGIDAVVVAACLIGVGLSWGGGFARATLADLAAAAAFAALLMLPHKSAGWLALGILGGYSLFAHRRDAHLAAAGGVFAAVAAYEIVARLLLTLLAPSLTRLDASLTALLLDQFRDGISRDGNVIITGVGYELVVVAACVAFKSIAQAVLCCFAVTRLFRPAWSWSEAWLWAVLAGLIVLLNTVRLTLSAWDLAYYRWLHGDIGGMAFGMLVLATALGFALHGVRHELWPPAPRP